MQEPMQIFEGVYAAEAATYYNYFGLLPGCHLLILTKICYNIHMQINLQSKNIELTDEIRYYALKRVTNLEKLLSRQEKDGGEVKALFEISRSTNHHKLGFVFHADCSINIDGKSFYAADDSEDLYAAIDNVKEMLFKEISKEKSREHTLMKRGAASVKKMLKGLSKRNPFTSKY